MIIRKAFDMHNRPPCFWVPRGSLVGAFAPLFLTAIAAMGCSRQANDKWTRDRPATYPVTGTVNLQGRPIEAAKVQFSTQSAGREYVAFGYTDSSGRFRLRTFRDGDGAVEGDHRVTVEKITWSESKPAETPGGVVPPPKEISHLAARYREPESSGLTATVSAKGPNDIPLNLE
jgi:hypothetical protein